MTTYTGSNDLCVIQRCDYIRKGTWRNQVTRFTYVSGIRMISWFATGNTTVMTAHTGTQYLAMIKRRNKR